MVTVATRPIAFRILLGEGARSGWRLEQGKIIFKKGGRGRVAAAAAQSVKGVMMTCQKKILLPLILGRIAAVPACT